MSTPRLVLILVVLGVVGWRLTSASSRPPRIEWTAARVAAFTADLHDADGRAAPARTLRDAKRILVYFSASWCPPCRAFTPQFCEYYRKRGGGTRFEVLFVSADQDAEAMAGYMTADDMPWWGVRYGSPTAIALQAYAGRGIPCLVMLDRSGRVLADSYDGDTYLGPSRVLTALDAEDHPN